MAFSLTHQDLLRTEIVIPCHHDRCRWPQKHPNVFTFHCGGLFDCRICACGASHMHMAHDLHQTWSNSLSLTWFAYRCPTYIWLMPIPEYDRPVSFQNVLLLSAIAAFTLLQDMGGFIQSRVQRAREARKRNSAPLYNYQPLDPGYIRLLDLTSQPGQELRCRLRHVKLDNRLPYVALSYVWGNPDTPFSIKVVDGPDRNVVGWIPLTASLQNALRDLRDCAHFQHPKAFWIDQICINQRESIEKNHQVSLMKRIYETATAVVTYLGPEERGDWESISLLQKIHQVYVNKMQEQTADKSHDAALRDVCSKLREFYLNPENCALTYQTEEDIPLDLRFPLGRPRDRAAYNHLNKSIVSTSWTQRLWLVQENVVNRHAGFLRGPFYITWDCVGMLCALSMVGILSPINATVEVADLHQFRVARFGNVVDRSVSDGLYDIMARISVERECGDVRDKIYAVIGLACDAKELGILPEYEKSSAQVFTNLAVQYVEKSRKHDPEHELDVLEWVGRQRSPDPLLPSWVPAFISDLYVQPPTSKQVIETNGQLSSPRGRASFESTPFLEPSIEDANPTPSIENGILVVQGRRLTLVKDFFGSFIDDFKSPLRHRELLSIITTLHNICAQLGDSDEACASICRTLIMDPSWPRDSETGTKDAAEALRSVSRILDMARHGMRVNVEGTDLFYLPIAHLDKWELAAHVIKHSRGMMERALWMTVAGNLVLAPRTVQRGDIPVVLFGGRWVYFLRPSEGMFEYIGWGYVHGFMKGEAFEDEGWQDEIVTFKIK